MDEEKKTEETPEDSGDSEEKGADDAPDSTKKVGSKEQTALKNAGNFPKLEEAKKIMSDMDKKKEDLIKVGQDVERKIKELDEKMAEAAVYGSALAGQYETKEEKQKKAAMSLVEGTGLNPFAE